VIFHVAGDAPAAWPSPAIDLSTDGAHLAVPVAGKLVLDVAVVVRRPRRRTAGRRHRAQRLGPRPAWRRAADPSQPPAGRTVRPRRPTLHHHYLRGERHDRAAHGRRRSTGRRTFSPDAASPIAPANLPVALRVMLGEASLPLSELVGLRPGSTVVLGGSARDTTAVLLAGDHPIATGRLVAVGEAYGVLIEHLAKGA
jgi:type III secretion protein Q